MASPYFIGRLIPLIILAILTACILALVLCNALAWAKIGEASAPLPPSLSVLIPARNEEANIVYCLDAVCRQGAVAGEILVYDDHSTDATAEVVRRYATGDTRVRLIEALPLPTEWCGKNFACWQLAQAASYEWLLFLDADARLDGGVLKRAYASAATRMLAEAHRRHLTFLSCWPELVMASFWEKLLMPMLNVVVFSLFPAPFSDRPRPSLGIAHGACILARREIYFKVGGHQAVRGEIFEDVRLAQRWRERGERGLCLDGRGVIRVRMYDAFGEIWQGFQKNFYPAFRREINFWLFLLFHFVVFLAPFLLLPLAAFGVVEMPFVLFSAASVLAIRFVLALRFRHPLWAVLLHPFAEAVLLALGVSSWWRCRMGAGVVWKGRPYRGAK